MNEPTLPGAAEAACRRLGELAAATTATTRAPDLGQWAEIEARLDHRRQRYWPLLAGASLTALIVAVAIAAKWQLTYRVRDCRTSADAIITSLGSGRIELSDGSRIDLPAPTRVRLRPLPFARGAELTLYAGEANLAVVHRWRGHFSVLAGPFRIEVTGTRFTVSWSERRLRVAVQEGVVRVSGGQLARPSVLHAGDSLEAGSPRNPKEQASAPGPAGAAPDHHATPLPARSQLALAHRPPKITADSPPAAPPSAARSLAIRERHSATPLAPELAPDFAGPSVPAWPLPAFPATEDDSPAPRRVQIGRNGWLSGGLYGFASLARGNGASFSKSVERDDQDHLFASSGQLCAQGTLAGLRCVNENLPKMRCDWQDNWGVAIVLNATADGKAWAGQAAGALAVYFHGRYGRYRLNAHRAGDPSEQAFCVDDYKPGQVVKPAMFKSECWANQGQPLPDFREVDHFTLQLPAGMEYAAFHYCISSIELLP